MRVIHYSIAALFLVVLSPLMLVQWIIELRFRAKWKREDEAAQFEDNLPEP